jgi:hypothetical protein
VDWNPQREIHSSASTETRNFGTSSFGLSDSSVSPLRRRAVDAHPDRPGWRRIAFGCAGLALVGDGPATTTMFVLRLHQLSAPACLGELAPVVLENRVAGEETEADDVDAANSRSSFSAA